MLPRTSERSPFVGLPGTANTLKMERDGGRVVCRLNPMVRTVVYVAIGIVGFGIAGFALQSYPRISWTILLFAIPFLGGAVFVLRKLGSNRKLEIDPIRKELAFYDGGPFPAHRLGKAECRSFSIKTVRYEGKDVSCDNHILIAEAKEGETAWLCISADQGLIQGFLEDCRRVLGE